MLYNIFLHFQIQYYYYVIIYILICKHFNESTDSIDIPFFQKLKEEKKFNICFKFMTAPNIISTLAMCTLSLLLKYYGIIFKVRISLSGNRKFFQWSGSCKGRGPL